MVLSQVIVVGLGSGEMDQLTLGAWNMIRDAGKLYVRTADHPVVQQLQAQGIDIHAYDHVYEQFSSFPDVYESIVEQVLQEASATQSVVFGVPGHPSVAESTVRLLREKSEEKGVALKLVGGESFLDQAFLAFGIDPVDGCLLLDASSMCPEQLQPRLDILITQVYDTFTASDAKLTLLEVFPPDYEIFIGYDLGITDAERIIRLPLEELDRQEKYGNRCMIWVPRCEEPSLRNRTFERLREIVEILRSPEGCPWDREQTHESIRKNLIEETCEVLETIDNDDPEAMCEELGDLLLQIMLHAQMEAESGMFTVYDVIEELNKKLLRRHPHVFGNQQAHGAEEALKNWEQVKRQEKEAKGIDVASQSILHGIPPALPESMKALEYQKKAAKVGFDWGSLEGVFAKLEEELDELREVLFSEDTSASLQARQQEEWGDVWFSLLNVARFMKMDPELASAKVNRKFYERFRYIEMSLSTEGLSFQDVDIDKLEALWQEAKRLKREKT